MKHELFHSDSYRALITQHLYQSISFLLENDQEFSLAAEIEHIDFDPELPEDIVAGFGETVLFVMAGYALESLTLEEERLFFEAGFGKENIGAVVTLPLLAIKQLYVGEYPVLINISQPKKTIKADTNLSMEALLRNPENHKLFKNKKH